MPAKTRYEQTIAMSPLTGEIFLGKINPKKPGEWVGEKINITSRFIDVMLQKFGPEENWPAAQTVINGSEGSKFEVKIIRKMQERKPNAS